MSRPWMYGNRTTPEFWNGLKEFSNVALDHQRKTLAETIFCPCHDCKNVKRWSDIKEIEYHLVRRGFVDDYHIWIWHGEKLGATATIIIMRKLNHLIVKGMKTLKMIPPTRIR